MANETVLTHGDGVDFSTIDYRDPITGQFDPRNWSYKINGPALRYLIATSLYTDSICYVSHAYQPGPNTDHVISQKPGEIGEMLRLSEELAMADRNFTVGEFIRPDGTNTPEQRLLRVAQARHEKVNGMMKEWGILCQRFRNDKHLHEKVVNAIATITNIQMSQDRPPMSIKSAIRRYAEGSPDGGVAIV